MESRRTLLAGLEAVEYIGPFRLGVGVLSVGHAMRGNGLGTGPMVHVDEHTTQVEDEGVDAVFNGVRKWRA